VDREAAFAELLDESGMVDVCALSFMPSQIWRELDETAFRCGVNDYADGQSWVEVAGETYEQDDAEKVKTELVDELQTELDRVQGEIDELEAAPDPHNDEIADKTDEAKKLQRQIDELEKHSF
jgi:peptidoglycan hydrolase CwlO-like protein